MRALIQRVSNANVAVAGKIVGEIGSGLLIFVGITHADDAGTAAELAKKTAAMRIFEDEKEKMNLSIKETGGSVLIISQFTLYADTSRGNRPSFTDAARPDEAEKIYEAYVDAMRSELSSERVRTGIFGAMMDIMLVNEGPVTIFLESK